MAVPISIRNMPDHIWSQLNSNKQSGENGAPRSYDMLQFPKSKVILWDSTPNGTPIYLNVGCYRKPKVHLSDKLLRLLQRQCEHHPQQCLSTILLGSLIIDDDGEGVTFQIDRLDTRQNVDNSLNLAPEDVTIPFQVYINGSKERECNVEEYNTILQSLQKRCKSKEPIDLGEFLLSRGWCNFYFGGDNSVVHIDFNIITLATEFKVIPISPVPIVPTALSKNLAGPLSFSHIQGCPKTGYLTMDHTRKLLLVLESDPKALNLPIVGIWVSGASVVHHPFVWSACLRYVHNEHIQDRVCSPPENFLVVLYSSLHSKPEFYECSTKGGTVDFDFDLYAGYEASNITKNTRTTGIISIELNNVKVGPKRQVFDAALNVFNRNRSTPTSDKCNAKTTGPEDIVPRLTPAPLVSLAPMIQNLVPDVSFVLNEPTKGRQPNLSGCNSLPVPNTPASFSYARSNSESNTASSLPQHYNGNGHRNNSFPNTMYNSIPHSSSQPVPTKYPGQMSQAVPNNSYQYQSAPNHIHPHYPPAARHSVYPQFGTPGQPQHYDPKLRPCNNINGQFIPNGSNVPMHQQPSNPAMYAQQYVSNCNPSNRGPIPSASYQSQPVPMLNSPFMNPGSANQPVNYFSQVASSGAPQQYPHHIRGVRSQFVNSNEMNNPPPTLSSALNNVQYLPMPGEQIPNMIPSANLTKTANGPTSYHQIFSLPNPVIEQTNPHMPPGSLDNSNLMASNTSHNQQAAGDNTCKSSDDSGLSVTPDRLNPSPKSLRQQTKAQPFSMDSLSKDQCSPEVYNLLMQQDAQLKQLQSQISQLLHNQQTTTPKSSHDTSVDAAEVSSSLNSKLETCSVAINTTLFYPESHPQSYTNTTDSQATPCRPHTNEVGQPNIKENGKQTKTNQNGHYHITEPSHHHMTQPDHYHMTEPGHHHMTQSSQEAVNDGSESSSAGQTPIEIRHKGVLPLNSTQREDTIDTGTDNLCMIMDNIGVQDKSISSSSQSESILDVPSFHSSSPRSNCDGKNSTASPLSASMCINNNYQTSEESQYSVDGQSENPLYYENLIANIQQFLNSHSSEDSDNKLEDTVSSAQHQLLLNNSPHLSSFLKSAQGTKFVDTTLIPKISYMTMMFDSDSDTSVEINAMAMKYLKDEQLTQMMKLQNKASTKIKSTKQNSTLLRQLLDSEHSDCPDVSQNGISVNDMTFATRKYMEKHGLLNNDSSDKTTIDYNYHLKTDYSLSSNEMASPVRQVNKPNKKNVTDPYTKLRLLKSPVRKEIVTRDEVVSPDFSPPVFKRTDNANFNLEQGGQRLHYSPGSSPIFQRKSNMAGEKNYWTEQSMATSGVSQGDDNILDIVKLKQLPKLL